MFGGFKVGVKMSSPELQVMTEAKIAKIESIDLVKSIKPIAKSRDTGLVVRRKANSEGKQIEFSYAFFDEQNKEVPKDRVAYFVKNKEGKEIEVSPFSRTKVLEIKGTIPQGRESEVIVESIYEMFGDDSDVLWALAKYLDEKKSLACATYSFGNGFKQYLALIKPIVREKNFVLQVFFCSKKSDYKHLMEVPTGEKKRQKVPTLDELMAEMQ